MKALSPSQQQMPLALPVDPALLEAVTLKKACELYRRSSFLRIRYASVKELLEDPVAGRCMRLGVTHLLRHGHDPGFN